MNENSNPINPVAGAEARRRHFQSVIRCEPRYCREWQLDFIHFFFFFKVETIS